MGSAHLMDEKGLFTQLVPGVLSCWSPASHLTCLLCSSGKCFSHSEQVWLKLFKCQGGLWSGDVLWHKASVSRSASGQLQAAVLAVMEYGHGLFFSASLFLLTHANDVHFFVLFAPAASVNSRFLLTGLCDSSACANNLNILS